MPTTINEIRYMLFNLFNVMISTKTLIKIRTAIRIGTYYIDWAKFEAVFTVGTDRITVTQNQYRQGMTWTLIA